MSFSCKRNVVSVRYARNAAPASRESAREHDSPNEKLEQPTKVKPRAPVAGNAAAQYIKMQRNRRRARARIVAMFNAPPPKIDGFARPGF